MKSISQSFHHSPLSPSEGPQRNFQQKWQEEGVYDDSCFETRQDTCPRWLWPMLLDIQTTVMKEIILYQYKRIVLWCLNLIITFQTDLILTSLSNPKKMIITKKNIAQSWGSGIRATARGYAMNANPGPAKGKNCHVLEQFSIALGLCQALLNFHTWFSHHRYIHTLLLCHKAKHRKDGEARYKTG